MSIDFGCDTVKTFSNSKIIIVKEIISNVMCYTMLYMLEWMRKKKHRIEILRIQGLRGSALMAYIYGRIP